MISSVAIEKALPGKIAIINEFKTSHCTLAWLNNGNIKINQVGVIHATPLLVADSMGIVTYIAGCIFLHDMLPVNLFTETSAAVDDCIAIMTLIA